MKETGENMMNSNDKKQVITQEDLMKFLDSCYEACVNGIPKVSSSVEDMADDYLKKYKTKEEACRAMLRNQIVKCTTSGVIAGFGGFITMPIAIPANMSSVLYVQMRMIACTAYMAGYQLNSDQTQTFIYACLAGVAINELLKQAGVGAVVGGGLDLAETKIIAERGYRWFFQGDFSTDHEKDKE